MTAVRFEEEAIPAVLCLHADGDSWAATLHLENGTWKAPVVWREVPSIQGNPPQRVFDVVFVTADGLSSVVLTGQISGGESVNGTGRIAIHQAADLSQPGILPAAKIRTGTLKLALIRSA